MTARLQDIYDMSESKKKNHHQPIRCVIGIEKRTIKTIRHFSNPICASRSRKLLDDGKKGKQKPKKAEQQNDSLNLPQIFQTVNSDIEKAKITEYKQEKISSVITV